MWWRTRHGRGPPARHHLLEQLPGPAEHPCRVPLVLRIPLAPLLSHVLVSTPTNVAGRSPSNDRVRHKTPRQTQRRPHSRGAAPVSYSSNHRVFSRSGWSASRKASSSTAGMARARAGAARSDRGRRRSRPVAGEVGVQPVSYTHLRAHETVLELVCRLLLEKKKKQKMKKKMSKNILKKKKKKNKKKKKK